MASPRTPRATPHPPADPTVRDRIHRQVARVGKAVGHPTRLRLLSLLAQTERDVSTLSHMLGEGIASVSTHLRALREAGLIGSRRDGQRVIYRLANVEAARLVGALRAVAEVGLPEVRELLRTRYGEPEGVCELEPDALLEAVERGELLLLDLRPAEEFEAGHLPGARSLPFAELEERLRELPPGVPVVASCRGPYCVMLSQGVARLAEAGRDVKRFRRSMADVEASGVRLARGTA